MYPLRVNDSFSEVGVHQGSFLSSVFFIIVLKAMSSDFCTGSPWELLYAGNLVTIADTEKKELRRKMLLRKLRGWWSICKLKIFVSGKTLNIFHDSGKFSCSVCRKGINTNSIYCNRCRRSKGLAQSIDCRPQTKWPLTPDNNQWTVFVTLATQLVPKVDAI